MEKIKLTIKQRKALNLIAMFYDKAEKGCQSVGTISDPKTLRDLEKMDLIFKTKEGWFPSTKGQDYVRTNGYK